MFRSPRGVAINFSMTRRPRKPETVEPRLKQRRRIFLKEWRKFRGLTQEELAERVGWSVGNVSQLEQSKQGYSQEGLEALAEVLQCEPGQILNVDPSNDDAIWSLWERAQPGQRQTILEVAKGFVKSRAN